jgi:signal transduction histidine kinase
MSAPAAAVAGFLLGAAGACAAAWALHRRWAVRRGRLLAFALHELNTPATAASLTLSNLLDGVFGELADPQAKWAATARDQIGRLGAVAGETRDLVHMELLGGLKPHVEPAPAAELIETALEGARGAYAHADIPLEASVDAGLPDVLTDPERAARTLSGLLFHARKFRAKGPVAAGARRVGDAVVYEIVYEPLAITPADAAASLDLFYPARKRADQILSASGLGLGLGRAVMRLAGGEVGFAVDGGRARLTMTLKTRP